MYNISFKILVITILLSFSLILKAHAGIDEDISDMEAGSWYSISDSAFTDSDVYIGRTGTTNIFAYSGGAFDPKRNRLMIYGGGHFDANDNGIYAFDMDTYEWVTVETASSKTDRKNGYHCIFDCSSGYLQDNTPVSNHTADLLAYHPSWDALIQFNQGAPSTTNTCYANFDNSNSNRYLLSTSKWDYTLPDFPEDNYFGVLLVDGNNNCWHFQTSSEPNDKVWELKYSDATWYSRNSDSVPYGPAIVGDINTADNIAVLCGHYGSHSYFAAWDLSDDSAPVLLSSTSTGPTDVVDAEYGSIAYDPITDLFISWVGAEGKTSRVFALKVDPNNSLYHWYEVLPSSDNTETPDTRIKSTGPFGRWAYVPDDNVFILAQGVSKPVRIYKLSDSTSDSDFPEVTFSVPATSESTAVKISSLSATDATSAILGYQITLTPIPPKPWTDDWTVAPLTYDVPSAGVWDLYAWAMDAFGNISRYAVDTVEVNCTHIYVDSDCPYGTTYNPSTEACTGGRSRVYNTITEAVAYVNSKNTNSLSHIIEIDAEDTWTGSSDSETNQAGSCYGLSDDHTNIPVNFNQVGWATMRGKDGELATIQWLCHDAEYYDYVWGTGSTSHHSVIVLDNSTSNYPSLRLENLEIMGGTSGGAGIWVEPSVGDLYVKNCLVHDNQNGILTSADRNVDVTILNSQFYNNGVYWGGTGGQHHNLYIGAGGTLIFMHNYSADAYRGQLLKSRNKVNWIMYNRLTDESNLGLCSSRDYCANYPLDIPSGGESYVIGNIIQLGEKCYTDTIINYGREVYYTFEFENGYDSGGRPNWGTNFVGSDGKTYDMTYIYGVTGDFTAGTGAGLIDTRIYYNSESETWWSVRASLSPETVFADDRTINWDNEASYATSTGLVGWSWPSGDHYNDAYFYFNTIISECNNQGAGAGDIYYNQYLLRAHINTDDCNVANNAIISRHANAYEYLWYAGTGNYEKAFTTTNNYLLEESDGDPGFTDIDNYNFSLSSSATSLINQGASPGLVNGYQIIPQWSYAHPAGKTSRDQVGNIDYGAYEFFDSSDENDDGETEEEDFTDVDGDGIPDAIDPLIDSDNDNVGDNEDICPGYDDRIDLDEDGIPDGCDELIDSDGDGIPDDEEINPEAGFDCLAYLSANSDLPQQWGFGECMNHYKLYGFWEHRPVAFNLEEYLNANNDLPRDWSFQEALKHYNWYGKFENRLLAFSAQEYLSLYPDLPRDWSYDQAFKHYIHYGIVEGRLTSFDEKAYLELYPDLPRWWEQEEAFRHYLLFGIDEGRVFDPYDEDVFQPGEFKTPFDIHRTYR